MFSDRTLMHYYTIGKWLQVRMHALQVTYELQVARELVRANYGNASKFDQLLNSITAVPDMNNCF